VVNCRHWGRQPSSWYWQFHLRPWRLDVVEVETGKWLCKRVGGTLSRYVIRDYLLLRIPWDSLAIQMTEFLFYILATSVSNELNISMISGIAPRRSYTNVGQRCDHPLHAKSCRGGACRMHADLLTTRVGV
jgi:hypothetical protein